MTPEEAQALLDAATPGPWNVEEFEEQYAGCPPTTEFYLGSDDFQNIASAETTERYYDQVRANFALIAAAPALAELVAGLRYEYAVQVTDKDGSVLYAKSYRTLSGDIEEAWWQDEPNEKLAEKWWSKIPACRVRILRRLIADEEVMG